MKKLLIVEDEKIIRQGIQAIVKRSTVPIEEILMCKNGEEAYEIVKNNQIDVMITDIRMPKKDGVTLVKEIKELPYVPKVIVISGYDDFTYAVELLRNGAKEYLLKPIEREKMNEILEKLEKQIEEEERLQEENLKIGCQQLKYILLNAGITPEEITAIENQYGDYLFVEDYIVLCTNRKISGTGKGNVIILEDVNGQEIFLLKASEKERFISSVLKERYVGISRVHKSLQELKKAYEEALSARKKAFAEGCLTIEYKNFEAVYEGIPEELADQMVQMVGTDKILEANKMLAHIVYKTKQGLISPDAFVSLTNDFVDKICQNYKNLLEFRTADILEFKHVLGFDTAESYLESISGWLQSVNDKLLREFDDYKNKQKVKKAIQYIQGNYDKDLNMAVVSNYISMNYSLFSYVFKQYTGMNFVNYLKAIRIKEAKRLLEETDKKIIEISCLVGYENEKHFMKTFRSVCGVSPSEYRKNAQAGKVSLIP